MKVDEQILKEFIFQVLNVYEHGTKEDVETIAKQIEDYKRVDSYTAKTQANRIRSWSGELEFTWTEIFKMRDKIKNEDKNKKTCGCRNCS